jgi:Enoyl-CoA hydratase/carnithine racemase
MSFTASMRPSTCTVAARGQRVELNRPERMNAWNRQFSADLLDVITEVTENPEVRAVLITGAGRAFSSGADLKEATEDAGGGPSTCTRS